jgi:transposase InsO family protein
MHKHTKLPPTMRREVYERWKTGQSQRFLADEYHVDKRIIGRIILRGRFDDFSVHDSTNHRYRTIEYGLKKLLKTEQKLQKRADRLTIKRYEKSYPGEMVHGDTKLLPYLTGETKDVSRERLYVGIDDFSRILIADIMPDKSQESSVVFGEIAKERLPFYIKDWYTDRGTEWKGTEEHEFVMWCKENAISQHFTKPRTPKTNGKAERVIRTLMEEWHRKNRFVNREERRKILYAYVDFFNHERVHGSIGMTPVERLTQYAEDGSISSHSGDNAR